jgi:hypothetical protein
LFDEEEEEEEEEKKKKKKKREMASLAWAKHRKIGKEKGNPPLLLPTGKDAEMMIYHVKRCPSPIHDPILL